MPYNPYSEETTPEEDLENLDFEVLTPQERLEKLVLDLESVESSDVDWGFVKTLFGN